MSLYVYRFLYRVPTTTQGMGFGDERPYVAGKWTVWADIAPNRKEHPEGPRYPTMECLGPGCCLS